MTMTAERLVTDADREFFNNTGYWLGPKLFDVNELEALARAQDEIIAGRYETGVQPLDRFTPVGESSYAMVKIDGTFVSSNAIRAAATKPIVGQIAAELIGAPGMRLWHDQLLYKPVGGTQAGNVSWHQDYNYWRCSDRPEMITAWIPFHDADLQIGTMEFVVGSHHWGWNPHFSFGFATDRDRQQREIEQHMPAGAKFETAVCHLKAGHVSFHHCLTLHSSGPNFTKRPRRSLVVHMQSTDCRWRNDVDEHLCHRHMVKLGKKAGDPFIGPPWPAIWPR